MVFFTNQIRTLDPIRFPAQPVGVVPQALLDRLMGVIKAFLDLK